MIKDLSRYIKLGIFVFAATLFFIVLMYFIGNKRNLFSSTITVFAKFSGAEGLMSGNAVRFSGINIGTVESVEIVNDSVIEVKMVIENDVKKFIKRNSIASIGTDGLMGNKLVNITPVNQPSETIKDGDYLVTYKAISTADMLRTLSITNENVRVITEDLKTISSKLNSNNSLWSFLSDTVLGSNLKQAAVSIKITGDRTAYIAGDLQNLVGGVKKGQGALGALLVDTSIAGKLNQSIVNIHFLSQNLAVVSGDLKEITKGAKEGKGAVGTLLMDTNFVHHMNKSMENIDVSSKSLSENMEALKHSIFLRKYFKKQAAQKNKK